MDALPPPAENRFRSFLETEAHRLGFDAVGVASARTDEVVVERFDTFVEEGRYGTMGWIAETAERRRGVTSMWAEARSVIVLGMNYGPGFDPLEALQNKAQGVISVYARNRDYHDVIKGRLKELAGRLMGRIRQMRPDESHSVKVFVDTAPLLEKPLGQAAGLGWQGKHTNLVSREHGSWLFLGSIATTLALTPDTAASDACGSCRACQDICPTDAFPAPYQLDARRCISYLTIETKALVPRALRPAMGNRIYGCDDCLAVCPWNKFASTAREARLQARDDLNAPSLESLMRLTDADFRALFSGSPVKRIGRDKFVSNCLIAAGNSGLDALLPQVTRLLDDEAALVRAMAVWAFGRLSPSGALAARDAALVNENDDLVRGEWHALVEKSR
ncbi:tRNA epoxyqueuosine(34) reductase QueG [Aureimonas altamirensis]|uniref:tRNA epoxyqueuosine(34) reductase QueG n=1 Tax=Aureimonas altamirensis TaxID=370622 RepID=UPI00301B1D20